MDSTPPVPPATHSPPVRVQTFAGSGRVGDLGGGYQDGPALDALFRRPAALAKDPDGNLYVADEKNHRIRVISADGAVSTVAGSGPVGPVMGGYVDGPASQARFADPIGLCVAPDGKIYVADSDNQRIRVISSDGFVSTLAGSGDYGKLIGDYRDGPANVAQFNRPYDVELDAEGNLYVAGYFNNVIRRISSSGEVTTFAGNGQLGHSDGIGTAARLAYPNRITLDDHGNLYLTEGHSGDLGEWVSGNRVRKVSPQGRVTTLAGSGAASYADGPALSAAFDTPMGVDVDASGNVYVSEYLNHCIRIISPEGQVSTLAGTCGVQGYVDGLARDARFSYPMDVLLSEDESVLYIADFGNHRIRSVVLSSRSPTPRAPRRLWRFAIRPPADVESRIRWRGVSSALYLQASPRVPLQPHQL
jgi:sugar lactone lactonase YvrE